jgi:hypothetical protein
MKMEIRLFILYRPLLKQPRLEETFLDVQVDNNSPPADITDFLDGEEAFYCIRAKKVFM